MDKVFVAAAVSRVRREGPSARAEIKAVSDAAWRQFAQSGGEVTFVTSVTVGGNSTGFGRVMTVMDAITTCEAIFNTLDGTTSNCTQISWASCNER